MTEKITLDKLKEELKAGSNYEKVFNKELGYYEYDNVNVSLENDSAKIVRRNGFDGEEDMSNIYGHVAFVCNLPKEKIERGLSELVEKGATKITDIEITESAYGRLPYNERKDVNRNYKTDLEMKLDLGQKPIVKIEYEGRLDPYNLERMYDLAEKILKQN